MVNHSLQCRTLPKPVDRVKKQTGSTPGSAGVEPIKFRMGLFPDFHPGAIGRELVDRVPADVPDHDVVDLGCRLRLGLARPTGGALEGLSVFLSGTNLTDEPYVQYANDDTRQITRYSSYGSNYMLGASYRF